MNDDLLQRVEQMIEPILHILGYRLIEREFLSDRGRWILRVFIDKEGGGITIGDCESASRALEDALEVEELIRTPYSLEVSSPGIHRPLRFLEDFHRFLGTTVRIRTKEPISGRSNYKGELKRIEGKNIIMMIDSAEFSIPHEQIVRANTIGEVKIKKVH